MTDYPVDLDKHRGMAAQKATDLRRALAEVETHVKELRDRELIRLSALGSGSDYTPFLQHAGIAAMNVGFGGEGEGGSYHSIYDSFDHFTRFVDPNFDYGVTLAKTNGRIVLRLANADVARGGRLGLAVLELPIPMLGRDGHHRPLAARLHLFL